MLARRRGRQQLEVLAGVPLGVPLAAPRAGVLVGQARLLGARQRVLLEANP
jgi:hypothetical protein